MSDGLEEQGVDSLTSVAIIATIRERLGVKLSPAFFLDVPTGEELASFVAAQVLDGQQLPTQETGELRAGLRQAGQLAVVALGSWS